jgi:outer membrane lipoprotein carrier protein
MSRRIPMLASLAVSLSIVLTCGFAHGESLFLALAATPSATPAGKPSPNVAHVKLSPAAQKIVAARRSPLKAATETKTAAAKPAETKPADPKAAPANPAETKAPEKKGDPAAVALAEKVQKFYEKTTDFTADVAQDYQYFAAHRTMKASGQMQLKKPGMMRWDIVKPAAQLYLLDGKALYQYDPEDNEVRVKKDFATDALPAAVTFLWGKGRLTDEFDVAVVAKPEYGATVLELTPRKAGSGFRKLFFALDAATGQVQTSVVIDAEGNENRLTFTNVKTNTGVPADRFVFQIPKGASVQKL